MIYGVYAIYHHNINPKKNKNICDYVYALSHIHWLIFNIFN